MNSNFNADIDGADDDDDAQSPPQLMISPEKQQRAQRHHSKKQRSRRKSRVMRPMVGEEFTITEEVGGDTVDDFQDEEGVRRRSLDLASLVSRKPGLSCVPDGFINTSRRDSLNQYSQSTGSTGTTRSSSFASTISSSSSSSALSLSYPSVVPSTSESITTPGAVHSTGPPPGAEKKMGQESRKLSRQTRREERSIAGLEGKAAASSSFAPASVPGAVAVLSSSSLSLSSSSVVSSRRGSITTPGAVQSDGPPPGAEKKLRQESRKLSSRSGQERPSSSTPTPSLEALPLPSRRRSRRTSNPGLGSKAAASSSLTTATRPGAVAVSADDSVQITGRNIDEKPGELTSGDKKGKGTTGSQKDSEKERQEASKANPRGRTNRNASSQRKKRGGVASSLHSLVIGGAARTSLEHTDDDGDNSDDDASLLGASVIRADAAGPSAATTPPLFQSIDMHGLLMQPSSSNVIMGDTVSVVTGVTDHSALTIPIRNMTGRLNDSMTVGTTSTMATEQVGNTLGMSNQQASALESGQLHDKLPGVNASNSAVSSRPSRRSGGVNTQMRMIMDDQGHTMSPEEMRNHWETNGLCVDCGQEHTHKREKWGPFGIIRRMKPQTLEGRVYKGYCLRCHDVHNLRQLLDDPDVPMDLAQYYPANNSILSLQETNADEILFTATRKHSPLTVLCASVKFQIFCAIILVFIAGCSVGVGITQFSGAEPFVPPPPTATPSFSPSTSFPTLSPTSYEWNAVTEIKKDNIESFGYHVSLSDDGTIMAVSSPKFDGSKGRVDMFRVVEGLGQSQTWEDIGEPILGDISDGVLGFGMSVSGNGKTVAVGSPEIELGAVQLFSVDRDKGLTPMGQILNGPTPQCKFGFTVSLNHNGDRVIIGAPEYGVALDEISGLVQAYDFNGTQWVQVANDLVGENHGSRFGHSVSVDHTGDIFVVGAPLDDERWVDGGQIYWYSLANDGEWSTHAKDKTENADSGSQTHKLFGIEPGSMLGTHVSIDRTGQMLVTGGTDESMEAYPDAGVVQVHGVDRNYGDITLIGLPISGSREGSRFGYDVDMNDNGRIFIASGENRGTRAGSVRVFFLNRGAFEVEGNELFGPDLGSSEWLGRGPSVAIASSQGRIAVGYESILSNGLSSSEVRIYDYFAVKDFDSAF